MHSIGENARFPSEGINAAANLFALIVESELRGNHEVLFLFCFCIQVIPFSSSHSMTFLHSSCVCISFWWWWRFSIPSGFYIWWAIKYNEAGVYLVLMMVSLHDYHDYSHYSSLSCFLSSHGWKVKLICSYCKSCHWCCNSITHKTVYCAFCTASAGAISYSLKKPIFSINW